MDVDMLTVIIPTYNKIHRLKIALEALKYQTCNINQWNVLVIDDGSTDGTASFLQTVQYLYDFDYVLCKERGGRSKARNIGIQNAKNSIVLFMDDDIILDTNYIECVVNQFSHSNAKAIRGCLYELLQFGNIDVIKSRELSSCELEYDFSICDFLTETTNKQYIHRIKTQLENITENILENNYHKFAWLGFTGSGLACRRELLLELDGFDEHMGRIWGCEDFEFGYRFVQKHHIKFNSDCVAYHMTHQRANYEENLKLSFEYFYKKHCDSNINKVYKMISEKDWRNGLWKKS